jgi:hypothetical protein
MAPCEGEPQLRPPNGGFRRGPRKLADDPVLITLSCCGDSSNISPSDMELDRPLLPFPNLNDGS